MIRPALVLVLGLFSGGAAAQAQEDVDCNNAVTQFDMNVCADRDYEVADKELNAVYKQAMAKVQATDKELAENSTDLVGAVEALKKAQRAWITYRDGQCELAGFDARGGSLEPMLVSGCLADLTRKRTDELKTVIRGTDN